MDACSNIICLKDTFETASEICKLVKLSPQSDTHLKKLREETKYKDTGVHAFCPNRWTVRGKILLSLINYHTELLDIWYSLVAVGHERYRKESPNHWREDHDVKV